MELENVGGADRVGEDGLLPVGVEPAPPAALAGKRSIGKGPRIFRIAPARHGGIGEERLARDLGIARDSVLLGGKVQEGSGPRGGDAQKLRVEADSGVRGDPEQMAREDDRRRP